MNTPLTKIRAFTLIEMLVAVVLVALILQLATPAFTRFIQNNYSVSISNNLITSLKFARSEAIKRNTPVTICATSDANFTGCGNAWNLGWIIFSDLNGDGALNAGSDTILRTERLTGTGASIVPSTGTTNVTFNNVGFPSANASNLNFAISSTDCKGNYARTINISLTGKVSVTSASCP